jgi:hypothetical protein
VTLDGVDTGGDPAEYRRRGAGADLKHAITRLHFGRLDHRSDDIGPRDRLTCGSAPKRDPPRYSAKSLMNDTISDGGWIPIGADRNPCASNILNHFSILRPERGGPASAPIHTVSVRRGNDARATPTTAPNIRTRHRHQEFNRFLNAIEATVPASKLVYCTLDNYATHKHLCGRLTVSNQVIDNRKVFLQSITHRASTHWLPQKSSMASLR